jgi:hypothetical protein
MVELAPWLVFGPYSMKKFGKPLTAVPGNAWGSIPRAGFESRRQHDRVDFDGGTPGGDHRRGGDTADRIGHQVDVSALQCGVVLFAEEDSLAAEGVPASTQRADHEELADDARPRVVDQVVFGLSACCQQLKVLDPVALPTVLQVRRERRIGEAASRYRP